MIATVAPPAHLWMPPDRRGSYGDEVAGLSAEIGRPLDTAQQVAVDAINSYGPAGRWHTLESAVIGPRQTTGKSGAIALATVLADCVLWPDEDGDRVAWTAHLAKTHRDVFDDMQRLIEGSNALSARVRKVIDNHDEQRVEFRNGSFLEFLVRSPGNGRGLGGRTVIVDEALYAPTSDMGALLPVMAARPNPRVIYLSSAAKVTSVHLQALVKRGRAGDDPSLIWVEWCAPGSFKAPGCDDPRCRHELGAQGCVMDRPEVLRLSNPGVAVGRLRFDVLQALRRALAADPTEFGREFLGWHEHAATGSGDTIPLPDWDARADPGSRIVGQRVIALEVATDAETAAITGAGYRADGGEHLALVDHRPGTSWVVPRALQLLERSDVGAVVVDPGAPGAMLLPELKSAGLQVRSESNPAGELVLMTTRDAGAAAGMLRARIAGDEPTAWHRGDPILRRALQAAGRRAIGNGGWGFDRRGDEDVTPIVAIAEALWGLITGALPPVSLFVGDDTASTAPADSPVERAYGAPPDTSVPGGYQFHLAIPAGDEPGDGDGGESEDEALWIG